jgi:alpha-D-ribose 1-methylphosphonate 5-triphosphate synthase subunit PhnH
MLTAPRPSEAETRANAAFDALLWALSRPGRPRRLPEPGEGSVIEALLDRECRVHSADPRLIPAIMRTGAAVADLEAADHVFLGRLEDAFLLAGLRLGSDLYPDGGATVVVRGEIGRGPALCVTGPGVDGRLELRLGGLPDGFWEMRAGLTRYPMGFDLFVLDGAEIVGLPRSTAVEAL